MMQTSERRIEFGKLGLPDDPRSPEGLRMARKMFACVTNSFRPASPTHMVFEFSDLSQPQFVNGTTGFFRHRGLFHNLIEGLLEKNQNNTKPIRILAAPSSVGCEAYTLSACAHHAGLASVCDFRIDTFDRSAVFTALAKVGAYPKEMIEPFPDNWNAMIFEKTVQDSRMAVVRSDVKNSVRILEPQAIEEFVPDEKYNVVMMNNIFFYLTPEQKEKVCTMIIQSGADMMITTRNEIAGIPKDLPFVSIHDHPAWQSSRLLKASDMHSRYFVWARKPEL